MGFLGCFFFPFFLKKKTKKKNRQHLKRLTVNFFVKTCMVLRAGFSLAVNESGRVQVGVPEEGRRGSVGFLLSPPPHLEFFLDEKSIGQQAFTLVPGLVCWRQVLLPPGDAFQGRRSPQEVVS